MGLGAPKNRNKLSHDPNNTTWSKSTTTFGHRILSSQGWKPGDYLGAENATHGEHYTAANASHIRVLLREDNLGIGAKVGGQGNAETFGLSTLSGIFGRLNGKSDVEVQKQQGNLRDAELRTYQAQKFGYMNFVSGGLLVGDKIEELPDNVLSAKTIDGKAASVDGERKASKKRKAENDEAEIQTEKASTKRRKSSRGAKVLVLVPAEGASDSTSESKKSRKKRKERVLAEQGEVSDSESVEGVKAVVNVEEDKQDERKTKERRRADREQRRAEKDAAADEKARLKQEKRARKEERRKRKEEKRRSKAGDPDSDGSDEVATANLVAKPEEVVPSGVSTPRQESLAFGGNRHAVRQRYIMQKRMASMDPRALNEILMIKAQV